MAFSGTYAEMHLNVQSLQSSVVEKCSSSSAALMKVDRESGWVARVASRYIYLVELFDASKGVWCFSSVLFDRFGVAYAIFPRQPIKIVAELKTPPSSKRKRMLQTHTSDHNFV